MDAQLPQRSARGRQQAFAASFISRERAAIHDQHAKAAGTQSYSRRQSGRSPADNHRIRASHSAFTSLPAGGSLFRYYGRFRKTDDKFNLFSFLFLLI
jgi:hypothetical protein